MSKNRCIGISGINATDNPGPGVAVARSLKAAMPHLGLVGMSYDVHDPGNYMSDLFQNSFLMPYPTKGWEPMRASILNIRTKTGLTDYIPCLDAELPLAIRHQSDLKKMGISTFLPEESQFELRSKDRLVELAGNIGCLHPRTEVAPSTDAVVEILRDRIACPAVVKGKYYKAYTVYNVDTAILKATEIASEWGYPLLVQERIEGQEINLIGLGDGTGRVIGRVSIKKQLTTTLGKVWTAVTIRDERLDALCDRFCAATKWRGPFELECMINTGGIYLIEINPRFPAWVFFATGVGVNLPLALIDLMDGREPEPVPDAKVGKYLVRYTSEFVTELSQFQNLLTYQNRNGL